MGLTDLPIWRQEPSGTTGMQAKSLCRPTLYPGFMSPRSYSPDPTTNSKTSNPNFQKQIDKLEQVLQLNFERSYHDKFVLLMYDSSPLLISIKVLFTSDNLFRGDEKMIFRSKRSFIVLPK